MCSSDLQSCPLTMSKEGVPTGFFFYASTAPENGSATAAAQAAAHVTLQVSSYAFGGGSQVYLELYEAPHDTTMYTPLSSLSSHCAVTEVPGVAQAVPYFTGNNFCSFNLPAGTNGWWYAALVPQGPATGSLTMTYAANVALPELSPTIAAGATIPDAGQWAGTTFRATAGQQVTFRASDYHSVDGQIFLVFYEPNGSLYGTLPPAASTCYFTGGGASCASVTPPAGSSGLWYAFLEPNGPAGGSLTLTMSG